MVERSSLNIKIVVDTSVYLKISVLINNLASINHVIENADGSLLELKILIQQMKKSIYFIIVIALLSIGISLKAYAQPYTGCDMPLDQQQSTDPGLVDYCPAAQVPLDGNVIFLITAAIAIGVYEIRKKKLAVK
ncbi:MAG: hypothetical protein JWN56_762 [Sphingobacteriales bacterium]|nr:hypothetical protein [Sphingobacteriales bacterium]